MILDVTETNYHEIKNAALRNYAAIYVQIYRDFMEQVKQTSVEVETENTGNRIAERILELRKKGAVVRNDTKSIYINKISPSCLACQTGNTSATFFVSLKCHRNCYYCFNPNQMDYEYYCENTRDTISELDALRKFNKPIKHLALTGGEPLLFKDESVRFFEHARKQFPASFTRLYTCGDHIDVEILERLKAADLNEIRFSIRMHDLAKGQTNTFDQIKLAKEFIPNVMVEMPILPDTLDKMKDILLRLDTLEIFGINLLEFCFPWHNADVFRQSGYKIKSRPHRVLYNYWYAGGLPIAGSEIVCLDLLDFALQQHLKLGVHFCSLENKHTGQIYQQNCGHSASKNLYFSQKDYFFKSAKVFGDDIPAVKAIFKKADYHNYQVNEEHQYLEFHVERIRSLKKLEIEIGIASHVIEKREKELVLRELKVDTTTPQTFRLSTDV